MWVYINWRRLSEIILFYSADARGDLRDHGDLSRKYCSAFRLGWPYLYFPAYCRLSATADAARARTSPPMKISCSPLSETVISAMMWISWPSRSAAALAWRHSRTGNLFTTIMAAACVWVRVQALAQAFLQTSGNMRLRTGHDRRLSNRSVQYDALMCRRYYALNILATGPDLRFYSRPR